MPFARITRLSLSVVLLLSVAAPATADVHILPDTFRLDGREATHQILVESFDGDTATGPAAEDIELFVEDETVARLVKGRIVPIADGSTRLVAKSGNETVATASVTVVNTNRRFAWTFRNHVQSVLAKNGCNSGACHGALAGKGGFRLSLRGYDTEQDFFNIRTQQSGRRVDLVEPEQSLLLTKPTTAVPHKGGLRLNGDSLDYRVIAEWVAGGAPPPSSDDARLNRLKILPAQATLKKGSEQPLIVQAWYSDGRVEDVTHWAKFTSANEAVATVDESGVAKIIGPGEGAVTAWFGSQIVISRFTSPFEQTVTPDTFLLAGRRNFIDNLVLKQLRRLNLKPAERSSDEVFIRRAFIDTIGTLPSAEEVRSFLADTSESKRDALIEALLQRPEFVDYWTYHWSDLLMINGTLLRPDAVKAYYSWIHDHVEANTPWDQFVRELVTAQGSSIENGATNFYALHQTPEDMAENVSQAFMGLSIGCAKCHNHPLEKWTNDQYYGFANLFSRVRAKGWGGDPRNGDGRRVLVTVSSGELIQPRTGKPQPPTPLDAKPLSFNSEQNRRAYLADWLVSRDNTYFSRSITNRVWRNFMGVGLVEQVDDMRASNPASNEELLSALADDLVDSNYDLKSLMRKILQSEVYQRSSLPLAENSGDQRHYSRYFPRRLMAEVLLDAVSQVTEVPTEFRKIAFPGADIRDTSFYGTGTRAIQLYDSAVQSYFLQTFGRNQRRITCECERSDEPSMVQVLHINNGSTINGKLQHEGNSLDQWLKEFAGDDRALLNEVFLTTLARYPQQRERAAMSELLSKTPDEKRREVLEDIVWAIVSSREFLFNH